MLLLMLVGLLNALASVAESGNTRRVKVLLEDLGAAPPLRVFYSGETRAGKYHWWEAGVVDRRRRHYVARMNDKGRVTDLVLARAGRGPGIHIRRLTDPRYDHMVRKWLARLGGDRQTRLEPITADENGIGYARFLILRNGHPFVAQPPYAYDFTFTVPGGQFLSLTAREDPPPVEQGTPRITQAAAAAAVKPPPKTVGSVPRPNSHPFRNAIHQVAHAPELAWFLLPGRTRASLVWRIVFENYGEVAHKRRYGDSQAVLDATTGRRLTIPGIS